MTAMTITMTRAEVAEALFASDLQPSQAPCEEAIRAAVDSTVTRHGTGGCAALVACEFGDHPDLAVRRMTWVLALLETATP